MKITGSDLFDLKKFTEDIHKSAVLHRKILEKGIRDETPVGRTRRLERSIKVEKGTLRVLEVRGLGYGKIVNERTGFIDKGIDKSLNKYIDRIIDDIKNDRRL